MIVASFQEYFRKLKERGLEYFGLYYSKYRGEVVSNEDPECLGRLKISCSSVYGEEVPEYWAWPSGMAAVGVNSGLFDMPDIGDPLYIEFEQGRARYPIWTPGWWGRKSGENEVPWPARLCPPEVKVWRMKNGSRIEFDNRDGRERVLVLAKDGSYINIDADSHKIEITSQKDGSFQFPDQFVRHSGGNETKTAVGSVQESIGGSAQKYVVGGEVAAIGNCWRVVVFGDIFFQSSGNITFKCKETMTFDAKEIQMPDPDSVPGLVDIEQVKTLSEGILLAIDPLKNGWRDTGLPNKAEKV